MIDIESKTALNQNVVIGVSHPPSFSFGEIKQSPINLDPTTPWIPIKTMRVGPMKGDNNSSTSYYSHVSVDVFDASRSVIKHTTVALEHNLDVSSAQRVFACYDLSKGPLGVLGSRAVVGYTTVYSDKFHDVSFTSQSVICALLEVKENPVVEEIENTPIVLSTLVYELTMRQLCDLLKTIDNTGRDPMTLLNIFKPVQHEPYNGPVMNSILTRC